MSRVSFLLFVSLFGSLFLFSSCVKEPDSTPKNQIKTDVGDLVIPESFTWSAVTSADLTVTVVTSTGTPSDLLNGQPLDLLDGEENRIARTIVFDGTAKFVVKVASTVTRLVVFSPVTQTSVSVLLTKNTVNFPAPANAAQLFAAQPDADADGIPDMWDEYPDDAELAFSYDFPARLNSTYQAGTRALEGTLRAAPDGSGYFFQIFEDLWPEQGDYDLNDLIMKSRVRFNLNAQGYVVSGSVRSQIWAVGASTAMPHGFGFEFLRRVDSKTLSYLKPLAVTLEKNPRNNLVTDVITHAKQDTEIGNGIIQFNDVLKVMNPYYNNVGGEWGVEGVPQSCYFEFKIKSTEKAKSLELLSYMYRTSDPQWAIRTFGTPPTENTNLDRFRIRDDFSASPAGWSWAPNASFSYPLTGEEAFYRTKANLPWAVEFISEEYLVPLEKTSILVAYPKFQKWAESGGDEAKDWFTNPNTEFTVKVPK